MNNKKQELGQFNTTRKDYILEGFAKYVRDYQDWVDPFNSALCIIIPCPLDFCVKFGPSHFLVLFEPTVNKFTDRSII
jgi:hypothetical protein